VCVHACASCECKREKEREGECQAGQIETKGTEMKRASDLHRLTHPLHSELASMSSGQT